MGTGNAIWGRGMQYGDGECNMGTGNAIWGRGMQYGDGECNMGTGNAIWGRGMQFGDGECNMGKYCTVLSEVWNTKPKGLFYGMIVRLSTCVLIL